MSEKPEVGAGNVTITFANESTATLKPSLAACQGICRLHGNLAQTVGKVLNGDIDTIVSVISLGVGKHAKEIPQLVYETGVYALAADVIRFINIVSNGGRPLAEEAQSDEDPPDKSEAGTTG